MHSRTYSALVYRDAGEENWSILFPDFPEVASVAEPDQDVDAQALDALETVVEVYAEAGRPLPEPSRSIDVKDQIPPGAEGFVARFRVEAPAPVRVNISIDRSLLARIDAAAERSGMTRSGFLAACARAILNRAPATGEPEAPAGAAPVTRIDGQPRQTRRRPRS